MKSYKKIVAFALVGIAMLLYMKIPVYASTILGPDVTNYISSRSGSVSVGVYDGNTDQTFTYNPSVTYRTESVVKMAMLADVLYKQIPITTNENSLLTRMIENSNNSAASSIWVQLGSDSGVQSFFQKVGMTNTIAGTGGWWGYTTTTVADQLTMMKQFAYPSAILTDSERSYGLNLMENVELDQRWGTGYGIPSGVSVALKNGWVDSGQYVNSVGYINGQGRNYVIAVLTKNNPSLSYGIDTIDQISSLVWNEFGWKFENGNWYYYTANGKYIGWLYYCGAWYYLNTDGAMVTGWLHDGSTWYYLNSDGSMKTGWLLYGGIWYFLDSSGAMHTGWIYDGLNWYYFNADGSMKTGWHLDGGNRYYLNSDGTMKTGWILYNSNWYFLMSSGVMRTDWGFINNQWYYFDNNGVMATGWIDLAGKKYYLSDNGTLKTGWISDGRKWYYLMSNGEAKTGWGFINNQWYYFDNNGVMTTGWIDLAGKKYYLSDSGTLKTGWLFDGGNWYYLMSNGEAKTGWGFINNQWYYFDNNGVMATGWIDLTGKKYYLSDGGTMVIGWLQIDVKWYYFYQSGIMAAATTVDGYVIGSDGAWVQVDYVALGDSLAAGMTPNGQDLLAVNGADPDWGYPNYIAQDFSTSYQLLKFVNYGNSGYTTDNVITDLEKADVQQEIKNATYLTIDMGANDLLPVVQTNPAQAQAEIATISEKFSTILGTIDQLNPNVKVYVMGYYNPFPYVTDPVQKAQLDQLLQAFNGQLQTQAVLHGDTFVPTAQVINVSNFADYIPNPQNIHLSLLGYQVVAEEFWKAINH